MALLQRTLTIIARNGARPVGASCSTRQFSAGTNAKNEDNGNEFVDVQVNDKTGVATVTLQRLPVNSLNLELLQALGGKIKSLEESKCRGMILTSASDSVFSAGLDIREMYKPTKERLPAFWGTLQDTWMKLYRSTFPTVAVINGHSPAGGCLLACSCEYRIMVGPKFAIGLNETKLGIVAPPWFQIVFRDVVGKRQAELALTQGKMFSTAEAKEIGLIDEIVSNKKEGIAQAEKFLAQFTTIPAMSRKMTKETCRKEAIDWMEENMVEDIKHFVDFTNQPNVQKSLEMYMASLKK